MIHLAMTGYNNLLLCDLESLWLPQIVVKVTEMHKFKMVSFGATIVAMNQVKSLE